MDQRKIVFKETGLVALGQLICCGIMLGIYALLGAFGRNALLGALVGYVLSVGNFFFMAVGASLAADKAVGQDVKGGKSLIRNSYVLRLLVIFVVAFACVKSGFFDAVALVLPLLFVRPVLTIGEFFRKKGETAP